MKDLAWQDDGRPVKEPVRKLLSIGWSGLRNAIKETCTRQEIFDQSHVMNVLNMLCMVVNARAKSHDLWQEHFEVKLLDSVSLQELSIF